MKYFLWRNEPNHPVEYLVLQEPEYVGWTKIGAEGTLFTLPEVLRMSVALNKTATERNTGVAYGYVSAE